ncbi:MAG: hypothetical protein FWD43_01680 [Coriobacteriia bacterium]|nr:hypothetical protein [Coriobacteriia bacterium]
MDAYDIARTFEPFKKDTSPRYATVTGIHLKRLDVILDGFSNTISVVRGCNPAVGSRVLIEKHKTSWIATATIGGDQLASAEANAIKLEVLKAAYPVGSLYFNGSVATNPVTLLGFGTWSLFGAGRVPVCVDSADTDINAVGKTVGAKTRSISHTHTMAHTHPAGNLFGALSSSTNTLKWRAAAASGLGNANWGLTTSGSGANTTAHADGLAIVGSSGEASSSTTSDASVTSIDVRMPAIACYIWRRTA